MPFGPIETIFLAACVFFAGIVDALAGGGGLITLPAYLAVGLPPALALGTNKLSSCIGTIVSTARYHHALKFSIKDFLPVIFASLVGSWLGARAAILVDPFWIRPMLLAALPVVSYLVWSKKDFGSSDDSHRLPAAERTRRGILVSLPIGAYDGFFRARHGNHFRDRVRALVPARTARSDRAGQDSQPRFQRRRFGRLYLGRAS